jgi:hypothetical protein
MWKSKGGKIKKFTYIDKKGYKRFIGSKIPIHRWVAQKKLGRKLKKGEVVHHKNRNKSDNRASNLHVFSSQKAHHAAHRRDMKKTSNW